jgi:hypothetical protein
MAVGDRQLPAQSRDDPIHHSDMGCNRPWRGFDDIEFATMTYPDWFNHVGVRGEIATGAN